MVTTTRPSLLERLRDPADQAAWREFDRSYRELVVRYCLKSGLAYADAEDVCQGVMISMARVLPRFEYDPVRGRFRGYLARSVHRATMAHLRRRAGDPRPVDDDLLAELDPAANGEADELWEREWEDHHVRLAMRTIRSTHNARSVAAFDRLLSGRSTAEVAAELGMTAENVRKVKQRIGERLATLVERQIEAEA